MPLRPVSELGLVEVTDLESRENHDAATRRSPSHKRRSSAHREGGDRDLQGGRSAAQSERASASAPVGRRPPGNTSKGASSSTPEISPSTSGRRAPRAPRKSPSAGTSRRKDATRQKSSSSKPTSASAVTPRPSKRSGSESTPGRHKAKSPSSSVSKRAGSSSASKRAGSSATGSRRAAPARNATSMNGGTPRGAESGSGSEARDAHSALRDGSSYAQTKRSAVVDAGVSLLGGAIGVVGGILLYRSVLQR